MRSKKNKFFTLIELLMVIGIIAILASLLLPGLRKAKNSAQRIACLGKQRQIASGIFMYTSDNNDILPQHIVTGIWNDMNWIYQVKSYVTGSNAYYLEKGRDAVFACPMDSRADAVERFRYAYDSSFGYYAFLSARRLTSIKNPTRTVLTGDYGYAGPDTLDSYYPGWLRLYSNTMYSTFAIYHYPKYDCVMLGGNGETIDYSLVAPQAYSATDPQYPLKIE